MNSPGVNPDSMNAKAGSVSALSAQRIHQMRNSEATRNFDPTKVTLHLVLHQIMIHLLLQQ